MNNRFEVSNDNSYLLITIYAKKRVVFLAFIILLFLIWFTLGAFAISCIIKTQLSIQWILIAFWIPSVSFLLYVILWSFWGKEIVKVHKTTLMLEKSIFITYRRNTFDIKLIRNLRASGYYYKAGSYSFNMAYWGIRGEVIKFDYQNDTFSFGIQLDEKDAKEIVETIENYIRE